MRILPFVLAACCTVSYGQKVQVPERFKDSIEAFQASDKAKPPKMGGVVFVGSSTIRMWNDLQEQFEDTYIIQRGFGGSRLEDCAHYVKELVLQYKPKQVIVYAGDNDLNEGTTPEELFVIYKDFAAGIQAELPNTLISYVSIKPSPARERLLKDIVRTNELIQNHIRESHNQEYIDIYYPMMAGEQTRPELFLPDGLHMNEAGYALWKSIIRPHIKGAAEPK